MFKLKVSVGVVVVAISMLMVSVVHGGILWSGMDPVVQVGDDTIAVEVFWPSQYDCSVQGPIEVSVQVPEGIAASVVSESTDSFCGSDINTLTVIDDDAHDNGKRARVWITAQVDASDRFPVMVEVSRNGSLVATCHGVSNAEVKCRPISLD